MMIRLTTARLAAVSFMLTGAAIGNAFLQKKQFYPSVVYLTKSNPSLAILYLQVFILLLMLGKIFAKIFFGELRAAESEHLIERGWYAVTETCLAFTVFRDDFSPRFVGQFAFLLLAKAFHWLMEDRVDFMERSPVITALYHIRMMSLMAFLSATDSYFISHAYFTTLLKGASVQIVFGFEYAILMTIVFHVAIKYLLHSADLRNAHPWENKAVYLLYTELLINCIRCALYTVFVTVMIKLHTFPLFSIRPFYLTVRSLKKALNDVIMSRRAIHAMNTLFQDVTQQDLDNGDAVCIICREEMSPGAKKLPCSHIFHAACLRSWFQRQQTCPTCRSNILTVRPATGPTNVANAAAPAAAQNNNANAAQNNVNQQQQQPGIQNMNWPQNIMNFMQPPPNVPQPGANPTAAGAVPQMAMPPMFPMMNMPGMGMGMGMNMNMGMLPGNIFPLPFPPPPNLAGLSDDEVHRMESTARAGVETRIQCLQNVQTLLDAASIQLQQYTNILQAIACNPHFTSSPPTVNNSNVAETSASTGDARKPETGDNKSGTSTIDSSSNDVTSPSTSTSNGDVDSELRRRRLEFLEKKGISTE